MNSCWKESQRKYFERLPDNIKRRSVTKPISLAPETVTKPISAVTNPSAYQIEGEGLQDQVDRFECYLIKKALAEADGNQSGAAEILKVNRPYLLRKMKKHSIS